MRCTRHHKGVLLRYRLASGGLRQIKLGEFGVRTLPAARNELARRRKQRDGVYAHLAYRNQWMPSPHKRNSLICYL